MVVVHGRELLLVALLLNIAVTCAVRLPSKVRLRGVLLEESRFLLSDCIDAARLLNLDDAARLLVPLQRWRQHTVVFAGGCSERRVPFTLRLARLLLEANRFGLVLG